MANSIPLTFLAILTIFTSQTLSRTHPHTSSTTNILDVSSSLLKTQQLFSLNSNNNNNNNNVQLSKHKVQQHKQTTTNTDNSLTFELHSRISIQKHSSPDYKSLTLTRLSRDTLRVKSIQTRLDLSNLNIKKSDLKPQHYEGVDNPVLESSNLEVPVISGTSQGSGEYFTRVGIGSPSIPSYMVLDTGSDVSWVQCSPCADCYQQSDPIFDPALSTSFTKITCDARECKSLDVSQCRNDTCLYEVSYGDGSYTVGDFATETITFVGSAEVNKVAIGCGHSNEGLFVGAAGLIGLGGGKLSFPKQINATSFSYCLVDRDSDSASTLEFNSVTPVDAVTAPLIVNEKMDTFYYVDLVDISVAGERLTISPSTFQLTDNGEGGVIVDSGTAVTRLQTEAYNAMRDAFRKGAENLPLTNGFALFDTCYDLSDRKSVEVPTVSFHFSNGKELGLPAKNYLIPVDGDGTFCFAFAPTNSGLGIIGNVQQQGTRVSYDLESSVIGFSPKKC